MYCSVKACVFQNANIQNQKIADCSRISAELLRSEIFGIVAILAQDSDDAIRGAG